MCIAFKRHGVCSAFVFWSSSLVQSVERRTVNPYVAGSSPVGGAKTTPISSQPRADFLCPKSAKLATHFLTFFLFSLFPLLHLLNTCLLCVSAFLCVGYCLLLRCYASTYKHKHSSACWPHVALVLGLSLALALLRLLELISAALEPVSDHGYHA